jgi:acetyltransferase-like isoleucine patch superfamily enzyme
MGKRIDLDTTESQHRGFKGFLERFMRRFKTLMHVSLVLPLYFFGAGLIGFCLVPGIYLYQYCSALAVGQSPFVQNLLTGISLAGGFFLYGFSLLILAPMINFALRLNLKEWRGPYYSLETVKWFLHNALFYLPRYTFLDFVTPTPISNLFYQAMGMKIGRGVIINTTYISDPSLIEIGKKVTIGGSVTILAHYGQGGLMVISPIKIGAGCTIGLKASIMGGVVIGEGAKVMPHSVVLPKTVIPAGETWGGIPAVKIEAPVAQLKSTKSAS